MENTNLLTNNNSIDPKEIANYLNEKLKSQGLLTKVRRKDTCLDILVEASKVPTKCETVALIEESIVNLNIIPTIDCLKIVARQLGANVFQWTQVVDLLAEKPGIDNNRFLVCGLGSLGQYCVAALQEFKVIITAIDKAEIKHWDIDGLADCLVNKGPIIGDCRSERVLKLAGIERCRAIILTTDDETVNLEAAIMANRLNPKIRVVTRSNKENLNNLLKQKLDNFIAFDPTELPAPAFALASLGEEVLGVFNINNRRMQVVKRKVKKSDYRFNNMPVLKIQKQKDYRLLWHESSIFRNIPLKQYQGIPFYHWNPDTRIKQGDTVVYLEEIGHLTSDQKDGLLVGVSELVGSIRKLKFKEVLLKLYNWGQILLQNDTSRIVIFATAAASMLGSIASILLKQNVPNMTWDKAIFSAVILLLGGYGDVFGGLDPDPVPIWVKAICLLITLLSLLFVLGVIGIIADNILSSRFEFFQRRLPVPKQNHVVLIGLGRVGRKVASILTDRKQPFVALTENRDNTIALPLVPLVIGEFNKGLERVNLDKAKSIVLTTDDQLLNLELALMAQHEAGLVRNNIDIVIRTLHQHFNDNLMQLLPEAKALCAYALSAEAFVGAAFGENIIALFRLNHQTVLVTEYHIEDGDTLNGKLLTEIAYGYGVVPIYYHRKDGELILGQKYDYLMPPDEQRLYIGDRLIVLATIEGLRRVEQADLIPKTPYLLEVGTPLNSGVLHIAGNTLHNLSGCEIKRARELMSNLPNAIQLDLYPHQAERLLQELEDLKQIPVRLIGIQS